MSTNTTVRYLLFTHDLQHHQLSIHYDPDQHTNKLAPLINLYNSLHVQQVTMLSELILLPSQIRQSPYHETCVSGISAIPG